jgi:hypothetical protein
MLRVEFESTTPVFERAKTVATPTGRPSVIMPNLIEIYALVWKFIKTKKEAGSHTLLHVFIRVDGS